MLIEEGACVEIGSVVQDEVIIGINCIFVGGNVVNSSVPTESIFGESQHVLLKPEANRE